MIYRLLIFFVFLVSETPLWAQELEVGGCKSLSTARPGLGVAYRGRVVNMDYGFSVLIPAGLTGWGGVDPSAPFHGFVIYLDPKTYGNSCIDFSISILVELPEDDNTRKESPVVGSRIRLGNKIGVRRISRGALGGTNFENIVVQMDLPYNGEKVGLAVTLVTPTAMAKSTRPIFEQILSTFEFR